MRILQEVLLTEEECKATINTWKTILSLEDWTVLLYYIDGTEDQIEADSAGEGYRASASAVMDFYTKTLTLRIYYPTQEDKAATVTPWDMEKSIVHELVHILYSHAAQKYEGPSQYTDESMVLLEQSVEATANALIAVKRGLYVSSSS